MHPARRLTLALLVLGSGALSAAEPFTPATLATARQLRERALADDTAYELLRSLTTEVGPRLAGSEGDRKAVAWAQARLPALGFSNVRAEPVKVPHWERGKLSVELLGSGARPLTAASLGGSVGTDGQPLEGEVVNIAGLADLKRFPADGLRGKFVLFSGRMTETIDGSGYGRAVAHRSKGAAEAAKLGATAVLIRSAGTSSADVAHTGTMRYKDGVPKIPAVALSNQDADQLVARVDAGPVRLRLTSTAKKHPDAMSANVMGEIKGSGDELVLLVAHLDSWDLGTGAHDDGAGVAIITAAAKLIAATGTPRRTVRVLFTANEEFGLSGAHAYAVEHFAEMPRHAVALEADLGGFSVWSFASRVPPPAQPTMRAIAAELAPLGITYQDNLAGGGADTGPLRDLGVPVLNLNHDAAQYFRIHHTAADTLAAVDPKQLKQAVAAYTVTAYLAAQAPVSLGRNAPVLDVE
jgi:carboxypeptidase Q